MPALTLADAKEQLNIAASDTSHDTELADFIAAAADVVEHYVGPVDDRPVTERVRRAGGHALLLTTRPVVSVQSIVSTANPARTWDAGGGNLDIDPLSGVVELLSGPALSGTVRVTYTAGRGGTVAPSANLAARIVLQHLWRSQRGGSSRPSARGGEDVVDVPGVGFAVPRAAVQLLEALPERVDSPVGAS